MKSSICIPLLILLLISTDFAAQEWVERADKPGNGIRLSGEFVIDGQAYLVGGRGPNQIKGQCFRYDPIQDVWETRAGLPEPTSNGASFTINGKGYVACGSQNSGFSSDVFEYDPASNEWTYKSPFPGTSRYGVFSFVIGEYAYVGCGNSGSATGPFHNDVWRYDPSEDNWESVAPYPGESRYQASGFALNGKGYVLGGSTGQGGSQSSDLYMYDPGLDQWEQKQEMPIQSAYSVAIPREGNVIVLAGPFDTHSAFTYYPASDSWEAMTDYAGGSAYSGIGFEIDNRIFVGTGYSDGVYFSDLWELVSQGVGLEEEQGVKLELFPNPITTSAVLDFGDLRGLAILEIYDLQGKLIREEALNLDTGTLNLQRGELASGSYLLRLIAEGDAIEVPFMVD